MSSEEICNEIEELNDSIKLQQSKLDILDNKIFQECKYEI